MEAIVLAGGFGTRLAARLNGVPKPMAPIAGRPFLEILLRQLKRCGVTRVLLSVGYLHESIQSCFGVAFDGLALDYSIEDSPLGTGGAIRATLALAREQAVLVLNGDTFLDADFSEMLRLHRAHGTALSMAVVHQDDVARYGGVRIGNGRVLGFEEKGRSGPGWINAGAYVLNANLPWPPQCTGKFSFEKDVLATQVAALAPLAYPVQGFFLDIGVPEDFDRAQTALAAF